MRRLKYILALGAFFVAAIGVSACGSGVGGSNVATVAGNPISLQAFKHWMYVAAKGNATQSPGAPVIVPTDPPNFTDCIAQVRKQIPSLAKQPDKTIKSDCSQLFTSLSQQVMDFLIRAYWYQGDAHNLHINVTDADVQKAFQSAKKQQFPTAAAFNQFLTTSGQTMQDILFRVKVNQIYTKLLARYQTKVTPATIEAYYKAHPTQFGTPEKRDIRIVRANKQDQANAALKALKSGQSWTAVAKKYSIDPTKNSGGLLKGVSQGQEEKALDTAAFSAPTNKVEGVIHGQFGYYVFEVTKVTKATQQSLAQATPLIKQILSGQSQTKAQTAVDNKAKKDWLSKTKCQKAYAMNDCSGYKAPKTTSSATPTPTATTPPATTTAPPTSTSK
jgi:parvulin-like peptidyl-prolyl isomerase